MYGHVLHTTRESLHHGLSFLCSFEIYVIFPTFFTLFRVVLFMFLTIWIPVSLLYFLCFILLNYLLSSFFIFPFIFTFCVCIACLLLSYFIFPLTVCPVLISFTHLVFKSVSPLPSLFFFILPRVTLCQGLFLFLPSVFGPCFCHFGILNLPCPGWIVCLFTKR